MTAAVAVAEKTTEAKRPEPMFEPISPYHCKKAIAGELNNEWRIQLPGGIGAEQFKKSPEIWRNILTNKNTQMHRLDRIVAQTSDGGTIIEAYVGHFDNTTLELTGIRIFNATPLDKGAPRSLDDKYAVRYDVASEAAGYAVFRCTDNRRMSSHRPDIGAAVTDLNNLTPRKGMFSV